MYRNIISDQIMFTQEWKDICNQCGLNYNSTSEQYLSEDSERIIKYTANKFGPQDMMIRIKISINEFTQD